MIGRITAVTGHTITVRGQGGRATTYAITNDTRVTKFVAGRPADLAVGEMVSVCVANRREGATASTILSL